MVEAWARAYSRKNLDFWATGQSTGSGNTSWALVFSSPDPVVYVGDTFLETNSYNWENWNSEDNKIKTGHGDTVRSHK